MLCASVIFVGVYYLFLYKYKNPWLAIIAPMALFLTPRFLGHIPANPKDIPFAIVYFFGLISILVSSKSKNPYLQVLLLGVVFGFAQSIRVVGFSLYIVYFLFSLRNKTRAIGTILLQLFVVFAISNFVMVVTWPYLGANYFHGFKALLTTAKSFQDWDCTVLFMGDYITRSTRPWYYLPVWIFITTPVSVLVFFLSAGIFVKKNKRGNDVFVLLLLALVVNLVLYLGLNPVIYNGLRHFLFLLPILVCLATISFVDFLITIKPSVGKNVLIILVCSNFFMIGVALFKLHPYEYIYFNELVGGLSGAQDTFELDYWGAGYKESIEWFVDNLNDINPSVYMCNMSIAADVYSYRAMRLSPHKYLVDYTICDYERDKAKDLDGNIVYSVTRGGVPLNIVRKN